MNPRKPKEKEQAIALRKQGYSYNEISQKLNVAKSTCSLWFKNIRLEKSAIQRLVDRQNNGRSNGHLTLRQYREERDSYIKQKVEKVVQKAKISPEVGKLLCAALYWAEGEKKRNTVAFSNSNPAMVKVFISLLRNYFDISEKKLNALLHLHGYHNIEKQKHFWSKVTGIPTKKIASYLKPNSGINIRPGYPGCISIRYHDVRLAKEIQFLYNALIGIISGGVV